MKEMTENEKAFEEYQENLEKESEQVITDKIKEFGIDVDKANESNIYYILHWFSIYRYTRWLKRYEREVYEDILEKYLELMFPECIGEDLSLE